jgi:hypothetical protein
MATTPTSTATQPVSDFSRGEMWCFQEDGEERLQKGNSDDRGEHASSNTNHQRVTITTANTNTASNTTINTCRADDRYVHFLF